MFCTINVDPRFSSASFFDLHEVSSSKLSWCFVFTLSQQTTRLLLNELITSSSTFYYTWCIVICLCVHIQLNIYLCVIYYLPTSFLPMLSSTSVPTFRCLLLECLTILDFCFTGLYYLYKARRDASQPNMRDWVHSVIKRYSVMYINIPARANHVKVRRFGVK